MNSDHCYTRQLLVLLLMLSFIVTPHSLSAGASEKTSGLQFTPHPDGTFSVVSQSVPLEILLSKIGEAANVKIYVDSESKKRTVTIDVKNISLIQLLKRIAGDNYALVYDGHDVTALHVLPQGKAQSAESAVAFSDFSGQVKISNQRARMFFMPVDNTKDATDNYIKKRHEVLSKLSKEVPHKELHAQISFNGYLSSDQIVALLNEKQLDPVTLNIGWKDNGGGYDLKRGESIEEAIASAALHHNRFIEQLQEDADMQVAKLRQKGISDAQMRSELAFQQNANDLTSVFHDKGVPFYGVRVAATAKQLHALTSDDQTIRLVDPLWGGTVEDEIANVYPTTKIAMPLVPDNEIFIPEVKEDGK